MFIFRLLTFISGALSSSRSPGRTLRPRTPKPAAAVEAEGVLRRPGRPSLKTVVQPLDLTSSSSNQEQQHDGEVSPAPSSFAPSSAPAVTSSPNKKTQETAAAVNNALNASRSVPVDAVRVVF